MTEFRNQITFEESKLQVNHTLKREEEERKENE